MSCDCEQLAAQMAVDAAAVAVANAAVTVAQNNLSAANTQYWYDQYNYMLCGCGGSMMMAVAAGVETSMESIGKLVLARDANEAEMATLTQFPSLLRLHQLVVAQIQQKG